MTFLKNKLIFLLLFSFINSNGKNSKLTNNDKECSTIDGCHACSFSELKTIDECQVNGYMKKMRCIKKNNEEKIDYESCNENMKINSVYIFLTINIVIFIISYRYQKSQKDSSLKNLMVKLSILKN